MEVENAKILYIGEVKESKKGYKLLSIKVQMPSGEPRVFLITESRNPHFDLVRLFLRDYFKVGQLVAFDFNKAEEDWQFDKIWKLKIREQVHE